MSMPPLANAELAIMELLWRQERVTAREIRERLYPDATRAQHGTVQKLLQRLEEKGYVGRDRDVPASRFSATLSREEYACGQLESLARKLTGGSLAPLITHMVEGGRVSREEIERLRRILEREPGDEERA